MTLHKINTHAGGGTGDTITITTTSTFATTATATATAGAAAAGGGGGRRRKPRPSLSAPSTPNPAFSSSPSLGLQAPPLSRARYDGNSSKEDSARSSLLGLSPRLSATEALPPPATNPSGPPLSASSAQQRASNGNTTGSRRVAINPSNSLGSGTTNTQAGTHSTCTPKPPLSALPLSAARRQRGQPSFVSSFSARPLRHRRSRSTASNLSSAASSTAITTITTAGTMPGAVSSRNNPTPPAITSTTIGRAPGALSQRTAHRRDTNSTSSGIPLARPSYIYPKSAVLPSDSQTFGHGNSRQGLQHYNSWSNTNPHPRVSSAIRAKSATSSRSASPASSRTSELPRRATSNTSSSVSAPKSVGIPGSTRRPSTTSQGHNLQLPHHSSNPQNRLSSHNSTQRQSSLTAPTISSLMRRNDSSSSSIALNGCQGNRQPSPTTAAATVVPSNSRHTPPLSSASSSSHLRSPTPLGASHIQPSSSTSNGGGRDPQQQQLPPPLPVAASARKGWSHIQSLPPPLSHTSKRNIYGSARFQSVEISRLKSENERLTLALDTNMHLQEEQQVMIRELAMTIEELQSRIRAAEECVEQYTEANKSIARVADTLRSDNQALRSFLKQCEINGSLPKTSEGDGSGTTGWEAESGEDLDSRTLVKRELKLLLNVIDSNNEDPSSSIQDLTKDISGSCDKSGNIRAEMSPQSRADLDFMQRFVKEQEQGGYHSENVINDIPTAPSSPAPATANSSAGSPPRILSAAAASELNQNVEPEPETPPADGEHDSSADPSRDDKRDGIPPASALPASLKRASDRARAEHQRAARRRSSFMLKDFIPPSLPPTTITTSQATEQSNNVARRPRPYSSILDGTNIPMHQQWDLLISPELNQSLQAILSPSLDDTSLAHRNRQWVNRNQLYTIGNAHTNNDHDNPARVTPKSVTLAPSISNIPTAMAAQTSTTAPPTRPRPLYIPSPSSQFVDLATANDIPHPATTITMSYPQSINTPNTALTTNSKSNPDCPRCRQLLASLKFLEIDNDYYREANQRLRDQVEDAVSRHNALVRLFERERNRRRERRAQGIINEARAKVVASANRSSAAPTTPGDSDERGTPSDASESTASFVLPRSDLDEAGGDDKPNDNYENISNSRINELHAHDGLAIMIPSKPRLTTAAKSDNAENVCVGN